MADSGDIQDRAEEIAELAKRLFRERGYDNTPMSLLSREIGLTKPGIYHHFPSKEHLLYAVHKDSLERHILPIVERAEKEQDPERRLRNFLHELALDLTHDPGAGVLINEARRLTEEHLQEIRDCWKRGFDIVRRSIVELQEQGRCPQDLNPTYSAFAALGSIGWIIYWFDHSRQESSDEVAKTIVDLIMRGLLVS